ncbi:MAG: hypothetical protein RLZZ312_1196 [Bacteroidota bacterium]|jgi:hypothetical protein
MFKKIIFIVLILSVTNAAIAQKKTGRDSAMFYKKVQKFSKKNKFRQQVYKLIFEPIDTAKTNLILRPKKQSLKKYSGKTIRFINIVTLDPFGYSVSDTTRKPSDWAERLGNRFHLKTKKNTVKNLILLKVNQQLDSLLVEESERLLRTQRYIASVTTEVKFVSKNKDSVDVFFRVFDSWSFIPSASADSDQTTIEINERNFLGLGHKTDNTFVHRFSDSKKAYNLNYIVPNFKNTFIKSALNYQIDLNDNYKTNLSIERTFFSPLTKWASGVNFEQQFLRDSISDSNNNTVLQDFKFNIQDYWVGHSFRFRDSKKVNDRLTNLIVSARFFNRNYLQKPSIQFDSIGYFESENLFLGAVGISFRKFVRDKYIFNSGIIEDVPIGKVVGFTAGLLNKNQTSNLYIGGRFSTGDYFRLGYLSFNVEVGSYFANSKSKQSAFTIQGNYFTNLISIKNWKLRQFIKQNVTIGGDRLNFSPDLLTINGQNGISGFESNLIGTQKFVFTIQTQFFTPYRFIGFRLNPFIDFAIAGLGDAQSNLLKNSFYKKIGIGLIINNDYLVFSAFQISLSYYPNMPPFGENIFKTNAFRSSDFGFQDFEFGKPQTISFR